MEASVFSLHFTVNTLSLVLTTHLRTHGPRHRRTKEGHCPTIGSKLATKDSSQTLSQDWGDGSGQQFRTWKVNRRRVNGRIHFKISESSSRVK